MKLLTSVVLLSCFFAIFQEVDSQEFVAPENYSLVKAEDYAPYEAAVLQCIDYLERVPQDEKSQNRVNCTMFLLKWLSGCPYISIEINSYVNDLSNKNPSFIMIFMGGWAKYALEHKDDKNKLNGHVAGLRSVIDVYKAGNGIKKDKKIEKLIKIDDKQGLIDWVKEQIKKDQK